MGTKRNKKNQIEAGSENLNIRSRTDENIVHVPDDFEIRELAEILYHQRISSGETGTSDEDWLRAENYLR